VVKAVSVPPLFLAAAALFVVESHPTTSAAPSQLPLPQADNSSPPQPSTSPTHPSASPPQSASWPNPPQPVSFAPHTLLYTAPQVSPPRAIVFQAAGYVPGLETFGFGVGLLDWLVLSLQLPAFRLWLGPFGSRSGP
jgi:hypothetical protein